MVSLQRPRAFSHIVGFDDGPFPRGHRGEVPVVGAVYSGLRLEGVLTGRVQRDGSDGTGELVRLVRDSKFAAHLQLVLLQGIALAGFNVIDVPRLAAELGLPVLVVARRAPRREAMRDALLNHIAEGEGKWASIEALGPMEPLGGVHVQRWGLDREEAAEVLRATAVNGAIPEPLRAAHLIAGALATGESRGRT
ncbi:DUF99 family protein [Halomonas sp. NO4]|uniref:endonuclease dU n=1 Tax=Halomonas sp. NO4 TaxID=2484813 RepID=UPI0013D14993|nr:DUF99 family protein [Halomonas sp. NO4]